MQLSNVSAIIAGGASGLGEGAVRVLARAGVECIIADLNEARGASLALELGPSVRFVKTDIADEASITALFAADRSTPLRIIVTTAFVGAGVPLLDKDGAPHDPALFKRMIDVNLTGTFNCMRLGAQAISQAVPDSTGERGVIINTASIAGLEGQESQFAYASVKAAIIGMTLPAARDLGHHATRMRTIAPGPFATPPLMRDGLEKYRDRLSDSVIWPQRLGAAEEFGLLVEHICRNPYLNAETIRLDGGARFPRTP